MRKRKIILLLLAVAVFLQIGLVFKVPLKTYHVKDIINDPVIIYQTVKEYVNHSVFITAPEFSAVTYGIGVYDQNYTGYGIGSLIPINVTIRRGTGGNFINVLDQTLDSDFQESLLDVRRAVEDYTETYLTDVDMVITMHATTREVGGPSASGTIAVALAALIENKTLRDDTVLTGQIWENGYIYPVGRVQDKIQVAHDGGKKRILIPQGNCDEYTPVSGIEVFCAEYLTEALNYMTQ